MMAQKHLHELLKEDQEPFLLKKYISERQTQLKRPSPNTHLQLKKQQRKSIYQTPNFPGNLRKNACFYSFPETPDLRKSPCFDFASPIKSPCRSPANAIFLHIPARTAAILLEAALRIQKQPSKIKIHNKNNGSGLFGSLFKRLTQRKQNRKRQIDVDGVKVSVKDILSWDSKLSNGTRRGQEKMESEKVKSISDVNSSDLHFPCSYNGRPSSAAWSESNEDKSLDMESSSSSSQSDKSEEINFVSKQQYNVDCACCDDEFCERAFRFVLQRSPSSGRQTPELSSPASSSSRHGTMDKENDGADSQKKFESGEEEEEKEQNSPVSVLDPPFEDDDDGHENDDDGFDLECSYAIVQRARQQLLYKLRRFEKLAELDPVELEKRMFGAEDDDDDQTYIAEDDSEDYDTEISGEVKDFKGLYPEVLFHNKRQVPEDLKRLISDLIMEEEREVICSEDREMVMKRVRDRLEMWKEVDANTIDMMIEQDFCREESVWKKNGEKMRELAGELELAIFGFLVEEFSRELVC